MLRRILAILGLLKIAEPGVAPEWTAEQSADRTVLRGVYVVFSKAGKIIIRLEGEIFVYASKPVDVFIRNPPASIRNHRHGSCFQLCKPGSDWFKLHFDKPPWKAEAAIACVEGILAECL